MTSHTPGPWEITTTSEDIDRKTIVDEHNYWVAHVLNFNQEKDDIGESKANARLIKNAPNMFGMLREALIILENHYDYCADTGEPPFPGVGALIYGLKEVITDVEGKE